MSMDLAKHVMLLLCHLLLLLLLKADSKCPKSNACGNFSLEFPFTVSDDPDCGLFIVDGCDSAEGYPTIRTRATSSPYHILEKTSSNAFLIHDVLIQASLKSFRCLTFSNLSLPESPFVSFTFSPNLTFFTCFNQTPFPDIHDYFQSYRSFLCKASTVYYKTPSTHQDHALSIPGYCLLNQLPIKSGYSSDDLLHLLTADYILEWNVSQECNECYHEGGQCLSDNEQRLYCSKKRYSLGPN